MLHEESRLQIQCVRWFRLQFHHLAANLIAIPNGGARRKSEAAIMKAEGVTAGAADLALFFPRGQYHGLFIEMKTPVGRQTEKQKEWQDAVETAGYKYVIARSIDQFIKIVNDYLLP